ncbi:hypothetical protein [Acinetobacter gerneri]|uniref:hypothetical protein n=1 Tax=Acinetobacter gerneri TaxID=202952 RepID=UPI003213F765
MIKLYVCILILISSSIVSAKSVQPVSDSEHEKNCRDIMRVANTLMKARQNGMSLDKMLEVNDRAYLDTQDSNMRQISQMIIRDAYEQPNYKTESYKQEQLNEFSSKYYLGCMKMYE